MALGAAPHRVRRQVTLESFGLLATGAGIGIAMGLATTRLLSGLLFQVRPADPLVFVAAALTIVAAGLVASYWPAREASRVDPALILRAE